MFQIVKESEIIIIEKKSKFITRSRLIKNEEEVKHILKEISKIEKGASHNCFAYRLLNKNNQIIERKNDDGEPGGTAGAPMLAVLTGENMINILVVTSRYFGGIKLGTGGLANVYKRGVKEVLKKSDKIEYYIMKNYKLILPINEVDHADYILKKENINIIKKIFSNEVSFIIEIAKSQEENLNKISEQLHGKIKSEDI